MAYLAFFFYSSGHHPDLHSFPTRRSSDLGGQADRLTETQQAGPDRPHKLSPLHDRGIAPFARSSSRDRKSTRLNSSHMSNSYAVFCLKKKIAQETFGFISLEVERYVAGLF